MVLDISLDSVVQCATVGAHVALMIYRFGRQDRVLGDQDNVLRVLRKAVELLLKKSGSIHPPAMSPRAREASLLELERMIDEAEREEAVRFSVPPSRNE